MRDEEYIKRVRTLTMEELLDEVFENPNYLTDGYYNDLGNALYVRYLRLKDKGNPPPTVEYRNGY